MKPVGYKPVLCIGNDCFRFADAFTDDASFGDIASGGVVGWMEGCAKGSGMGDRQTTGDMSDGMTELILCSGSLCKQIDLILYKTKTPVSSVIINYSSHQFSP